MTKFMKLTRRDDGTQFGINVDAIRFVQLSQDRDGIIYTTIWSSDGSDCDVLELPEQIDPALEGLPVTPDYTETLN